MKEKINEIFNIMCDIEYGFKDSSGRKIIGDSKKWSDEAIDFYYIQTPEELLKSKCGVCWDQVELERKLFQDNSIAAKTYFIYIVDDDNLPSHTFLTYEDNNKYYWFEHSWDKYKGIHEYTSIKDLLLDVKEKFILDNAYVRTCEFTFVYEYERPSKHITREEFYKYMETQKIIKLNKPLYFYHLVNKNVNMDNGLISLQYMYDNKMYDLFDKNVSKYKDRIINDWGFSKYKGKKELTREEYLDGLNLFHGEFGSSYIYFFRFPPYKELGNRMEEILKTKDIYRININDEEVMKIIKDIFYGYDMSQSDNKLLDKDYYENVDEEEYFSKYDDGEKMNFSKLNHIGISFVGNMCPLKYLEKM